MKKYSDLIKEIKDSENFKNSSWESINPEYVARMQLQNRFKSGIEIAKYNAAIMRKDMDDYDSDSSKYTQSLGCWHGFIGQQKLISIKKHFDTNDKKYLYLSGWMIAALRSQFGPLPDQSMHEKTSVASLINELYTFLRQADARELGGLFRELDEANDENNRKQIAIITKGKPIALLVASNNIKIPKVPIISSTGTLKPNNSFTNKIPPLFTKSS